MACGDYTNVDDCISNGCYWYNGACHTEPPSSCEEVMDYEGCINCSGCYWWKQSCHSEPNPSPGDSKYMMIVSPHYDGATNTIHIWMQYYVLPTAQNSDLWDLIYIEGEDAMPANVHDACKQFDPKGLFHQGHGSPDTMCGHNGTQIWRTYSTGPLYLPLLAGKIMYFFSCNSGQVLGPLIINEYNGRAWMGFDDSPSLTPYGMSFIFAEPWIALMEGDSVGTAVQRTIDLYNYWIDYALSHGQSGTASQLIFNRDCFVVFGDLTAKLIEPKTEVIDDTFDFAINVT